VKTQLASVVGGGRQRCRLPAEPLSEDYQLRPRGHLEIFMKQPLVDLGVLEGGAAVTAGVERLHEPYGDP